MFKILSKWLHTDHLTAIRNKTNNEKGEAYVGEATKIVIAVVLGAALLAGLLLINNKTLLPQIEGRIREWFFVAQVKYMNKEFADELFGPYYDLNSTDTGVAYRSAINLLRDMGALDSSYNATPEGEAALMQMQEDFNEAFPEGCTGEQENAFKVNWIANYAESKGFDTSVTTYEYAKIEVSTGFAEYYGDPINAAEYAEAREYYHTEYGANLPETPYTTQEEWEAFLKTGDGMVVLQDALG